MKIKNEGIVNPRLDSQFESMFLPITNIYMNQFGRYPNKISSHNDYCYIDGLLNKYKNNVVVEHILLLKGDFMTNNCLLKFDCNVIVHLAFMKKDTITKKNKSYILIYYDTLEPIVTEIMEYIKKNISSGDNKGNLWLIQNTGSVFSLKDFLITPPNMEISKNYNDDFIEIDEIIKDNLSINGGSGLVLLFGEPGTGKTTYIRHLINSLDKKILYLPPDLTSELSNPKFISFLINQTNSILIIEDAENILMKRDNGTNQAISNILNMTDGLFGDCLKIQIISTFNTSVSNIDEALLRKGRLIAKYEFKELTQEKANVLAEELGVNNLSGNNTLAEIYNANKKSFKTESKKIGF